MDSNSTYQRFVRALVVINGVLRAQRRSPELRDLFECCDTELANRDVKVAVCGEHDSVPRDYFTLRMKDGTLLLAEHGVPHADPDWIVSDEHVRDVSEHPGKYFDNPHELDLGWLASRVSTHAV